MIVMLPLLALLVVALIVGGAFLHVLWIAAVVVLCVIAVTSLVRPRRY